MKKQQFGRNLAAAGELSGVARFSLVTLFALVAGCAAMGGGLTKDTPPEQLQAKVMERAVARWQALIDGSPEKSYEFVSPASKEAVSLEAYKEKTKGVGVVFRRVEPGSAECAGEICKVKVFIWVDHRLMKDLRTPFEEAWVLDKGQAWYVWRQ
jgi:hypothetical protein